MKTKFFVLAALAAAVVFTSCSKDDEDAVSTAQQLTSQEIKFQVGVENSKGTRAVPVTSSNYGQTMDMINVLIRNADDGSHFAGTLGNPSDNIALRNDGNGNFLPFGSFITTYYWPTTPLSFYAWAFSTSKGGTFSYPDANSVGFVPPYDNTKQQDVMYAATTDVTRESCGGIVTLQFKHMLSQLNFKVGTLPDYHEITISGVTINGLYAKTAVNLITGQISSGGIANYGVTDFNGNVEEDTEIGSPLLIPSGNYDDPWRPDEEQAGHEGTYLTVTLKVKDTRTGKYIIGSDSEFVTVYVPFSADLDAGNSYNILLNFDGTDGFGYDEDGNTTTSVIGYKIQATDWKTGDDIDADL